MRLGTMVIEVGIAGAEVEVEPAVVIEVAEVGAHRLEHVIQMGLAGDIFKRAIARLW